MNRQQYDEIIAILRDETTDEATKVELCGTILKIDLNDQKQAAILKDSLTGNDSIVITNNPDDTVSVSFGGIETIGNGFAIAFLATLMNVMAARALDKFLPQAKPAPATGSRDGAAASPAGIRTLPAGINRG